MSEIAKAVGQRIRNYRTRAGFSQEKLAELSGCHPTYIGQLERGEKNATIESVEKIATALNLPMSKLFEQLGGQDDGSRNIPLECYEFLSAKTVDEQDIHIRNLNDEIDNFMNPEEQEAVKEICEIPGIGETSAKTIISIIGTDMERFPSDRHISKWAGVCPGNNESAKKRKSGRTSKRNPVLRSTPVQCALAAAKRKDSYFSAQYARISTHRGKNRAAVAVAHSLLIAIYHVLKDKTEFRDLGSNYYNQFNKERKANSMVKKLMLLGYTVTLEQALA